ncbi:MAG: lipid A biosynthesis acyltransferase [Zoogloea sp.]|nr:lipid A biosynthesis acyltransferase [Zoogloea sp.]
MSRILVVLLWLLHWLPLSILARVGRGLGHLLYRLVGHRRRVVQTNLRLCFPELSDEKRDALAREHFALLGRSFLERGILWFGSQERIRKMVRMEGAEHVRKLLDAGRPVLLLAPHFLGLDVGGSRLAMDFNVVTIYQPQRDKVIDRWLLHGRGRFGDQLLIARDESIRGTIKAMKAGRPFYYLPDMDHGERDSVFVPFFGVPAATLTGLSRFSKMAGATVVPAITRMLPDGEGYVLEFGEPWTDFPTGDLAADARRMNAYLEDRIRTMPPQYYWVHKRFKTRPAGQPGFY